jgi:hypothetical protein
MFRVSHRGNGMDDVDTIEGARGIVRGQPPGRYDVDEIRAEPFPSGHTSRQWGRLIRHPDGPFQEEPWAWLLGSRAASADPVQARRRRTVPRAVISPVDAMIHVAGSGTDAVPVTKIRRALKSGRSNQMSPLRGRALKKDAWGVGILPSVKLAPPLPPKAPTPKTTP